MIENWMPDLKMRLAELIFEEIGEDNMWMAHRMLKLDQPRMWRLEHRKLDRFSVQFLVLLLARLNRRVEVRAVAVGPLPSRWHEQIWKLSKGKR